MLKGEVVEIIVVFGILTLLLLAFLLLLRAFYSRELSRFRRFHPQQDLKAIEARWAQTKIHFTIAGDLGELVVWFLSRPQDRGTLKATLAVLLESACEGFILSDTYVRGRFLEWNEQEGELVPFVEYVGQGVPPFGGSHFAPGVGTPGEAFRSGEVIRVDNFEEAFPTLQGAWDRPYKSVVCVPVPTIPDPRKRIGVLNFDAPVIGHFSEEDVLFLRTISNYAFIMYNHVRDRTSAGP